MKRKSRISIIDTQLATNGLNRQLTLRNHQSTNTLSDQNTASDVFNAFKISKVSLKPRINSRRGTIMALRGALFVFTATSNLDISPLERTLS